MNEETRTVDEHSTRGSYVTGNEFNRDTNYIEDRITRDGTPGPNGEPGWPVEPGRYRLIAARACPWANRSVIVRRLLGLEHVISLGQPGPTHDARSWTFDLDREGKDPVLGIERLQEAYFRRFPDHPRGRDTSWVIPSPRRTSGCAPPWLALMRSTTGTSNAIETSSAKCRCYGHMPGICSKRRVSGTRSTSSRSSSTTT